MWTCRRAAVGMLMGSLALLLVARLEEEMGVTGGEERNENEMVEASGLCASQAVKLDDCIPPFRKPMGKFSPYVLHGQPVTWRRIKEAVSSDPKSVIKHVLRRTERVEDRLESIQGKELLEKEAVEESKRNLRMAQRKLEQMVHHASSIPGNDSPFERREGASLTEAADIGKKSPSSAVVSAMATTLAAEQHEIDELRERLGRMHMSRRRLEPLSAVYVSGPAQVSNATCTAACEGLTSARRAQCMVDCTSLAAISALEFGTLSLRHRGKKSGADDRHSGTHVQRSSGDPLEEGGHFLKTARANIKVDNSGGARESEDERLAAEEQKRVLSEEQEKIDANRRRLADLIKMKAWTNHLEHGGFKTLGFKEYGVGKAMKEAAHDEMKKLQPRKMVLGSQMIVKQMSEAGVSQSSMRSAFGGSFNLHQHVLSRTSIRKRGRGDSSRNSEGTAGVSGDGLTSESDIKALGQVGHIAESTKAEAKDAIDAFIQNPGVHREKNMIKIRVYPGSSNPLRAHLSPNSIGFWKKLDAAGVDARQ